MPLSDEQQAALERLRENQSLTDNLTDAAATALLAWAEQQILNGMAAKQVMSAVRAVNRDPPATVEQTLAAAREALQTTQVQEQAAPVPQPGEQPAASASPNRPLSPAQPRRLWTRVRDWLRGRT